MITLYYRRWIYIGLSLCFFLTAYISRKTYTADDKRDYWASRLETKLQKKEYYADRLIHSPRAFSTLRNLSNNENQALAYTREFRNKNISVLTYVNKKLTYWNALRVIPDDPSQYSEGRSFKHTDSGYYEVIKKTEDNFSVLIFIPIKTEYNIENEYLPRKIVGDLSGYNTIDIAVKKEKHTTTIKSIDQKKLFKVKLLKEFQAGFFSRIELASVILGMIFLCLFIDAFCRNLVIKGQVWIAVACLFSFIVILRLINIRFELPNMSIDFELFKPNHYADSAYGIASLGDFLINIILLTWFTVFIYNYRDMLVRKEPAPFKSRLILLLCIALIISISTYFSKIFHSLIINSHINFDVNNVLNLSDYSVVGAVALCFATLVFFLSTEIVLTICLTLRIPPKIIFSTFISFIFIITLLSFLYKDFTIYYIIVGCVVAVRAYSLFYQNGKLKPSSLLIILFLLSSIAALKLAAYQQEKEKVIRKKLADMLSLPDEPDALYKIGSVEKLLTTDKTLKLFFDNPKMNPDFIKTRLKKLYFDGYFPNYEFNIYCFDQTGKSLIYENKYALQDFKSLALYGSVKISKYFSRTNDVFGYHNYFALIPIKTNGNTGTLIIDLKSKPTKDTDSFPDLLVDKNVKSIQDIKDYSYAFYNDGKLTSQSGDFIYSLVNTQYSGKKNQYVYLNLEGYNHLIYEGSDRKLLVISKEQVSFFNNIAALTFFFIFFLVFTLLLLLFVWIYERFKTFKFKFRNIRWSFLLSTNRILYKTRIQSSIIISVVVTLLIAGFITYLSISKQYSNQQDDMIREKVTHLAEELQNDLFSNGNINTDENGQVRFYNFANTYSTDLTLYDLSGIPILTTQPKIYDYGFLAKRISAYAYLYLYKLHKSEYVNVHENIGELTFKAGYAPVKDSKNNVIAFLQIPYFSNQADYKERIGAFLNTLINVYALIFLAIGLFAVFVANQITTPLTIIQQNLSRISYGQKNEPIQWKRNDEIGSLIKEYNNMLSALDASAVKLGESERKGAWREMAKQVAHEIKNPLTPMKLGLQLLEKSWREKDPNFNKKFERFSKSFIEQIESLVLIANEFSNFAKMPETKVEQVNVDDLLQNVVNVYEQNEKVNIQFTRLKTADYMITADKDHLLRCFNNLLKNAIEATPKAGKGKVEITLDTDDRHVYISIKDNGMGIPNRISKKIFEPNFTTKSSGTGLGLAFVKNALENMNGTISFETEMYLGTTFYITLPVK